MAIELVPLARATFNLAPPVLIPNTPTGTHVLVEISEGRYEGERLQASQFGVASQWIIAGADGEALVEMRFTLETDDGAMIFVEHVGVTDLSHGPGNEPVFGGNRYQTGDERYLWLNKILAMSKGIVHGRTVTFEVTEVR